MSSETLLSFIPFGPTVASAELCLGLALFLAGAALWLSPGGLSWALTRRNSIPGPSGLPFLGLVLAFTGEKTHRILEKLARTFRAEKLMSFSVGFTRFVISSDPNSAKEMLGSSAFADRPVKESAYELLFHRAMGFAPYGEYWRNLRRISATHLFSPRMISSSAAFRANIAIKMMEQIRASMEKDGNVGIRNILHFGSLNNVMMSVFGKSYDFSGFSDDVKGADLEVLVSEGYELLGIFNWSDHFPVLGWFDFQGVRKRCKNLVSKVNLFVGNIISEHRIKKAARSSSLAEDDDDVSGDFVDVLLNLENENKLSDSDMIAVLWEMIFRGTDTVAILLEWILARMVIHPDIQAKVQAEIDTVVGRSGKMVSEADIPNLPYLQAVVKETLRVHPPGPLLSWARLAIHDTKVGGHFIPAGTTAMVNMWAITHNEKIWENPGAFRPERFLEEAEDVAIMGSDLRLAPFGAGRRVCPGKALGLATVQLWLAQLMQGFKFGPTENGVDLAECLKLSLEMKKPLVCKAVPRV